MAGVIALHAWRYAPSIIGALLLWRGQQILQMRMRTPSLIIRDDSSQPDQFRNMMMKPRELEGRSLIPRFLRLVVKVTTA